MGDEGAANQLAGDLVDLHFMATAIIPSIAENFGLANQHVNDSLEKADSCIFMDESGTVRPVAKLFEAMTDYLQDNLATNYKNLYEVSDALKATLEDLKTSDELNRDELEKVEEEFDRQMDEREHQTWNESPETKHKPSISDEREQSDFTV